MNDINRAHFLLAEYLSVSSAQWRKAGVTKLITMAVGRQVLMSSLMGHKISTQSISDIEDMPRDTVKRQLDLLRKIGLVMYDKKTKLYDYNWTNGVVVKYREESFTDFKNYSKKITALIEDHDVQNHLKQPTVV